MSLLNWFKAKKQPDALAVVYGKYIGGKIRPELEPGEVQTYHFSPIEGEEEHIYITRGMSARPQPDPGDDYVHAELILYSAQANELCWDLVHKLSGYPWDTGSAFLGEDLLPLGSRAERVLGSDRFGGLLINPSVRMIHKDLVTAMRAMTPPVSPLNIIPLLTDEFEYATEHGVQALMARNSKSKGEISLFDPARTSVLADTAE